MTDKIRKTEFASRSGVVSWSLLPCLLLSGCLSAQTTTSTRGDPIIVNPALLAQADASVAQADASVSADSAELQAPPPEVLYSPDQLQELVGPYALYPDNLLAIVLPASTYPLEIVLAARFLEELEADSSLEPDETWDESVVALLNYPEVVQQMNANIEATWQLGEAVIGQQSDVLAAIEAFRQLAYDAGNLQSDENQNVVVEDKVIEITTVEEKIVYVPQYIVEEVIVEQPVPVYHYYPTPRPVYYYPYPVGYRFPSRFFWGVTTAFSIGWSDYYLHVYHPTYRYHPYYGRRYYSDYHYRRPTINVFNSYYVNNSYRRSRDRHRYGSYWRPQRHSSSRPYDARYNRYYAGDDARNRVSEGRRNRGSYGDYRGRAPRANRTAATNHERYNVFDSLRNTGREDIRAAGVRERGQGNAFTNLGRTGVDPEVRNGGGAGPERLRGTGRPGLAGNAETGPGANNADATGVGRQGRANNAGNRRTNPGGGAGRPTLSAGDGNRSANALSAASGRANPGGAASPNDGRVSAGNSSERSAEDSRRRRERGQVTTRPRVQSQVGRQPGASNRTSIDSNRSQRVSPNSTTSSNILQGEPQQSATAPTRRTDSPTNRGRTSLNSSQRNSIAERLRQQPSAASRRSSVESQSRQRSAISQNRPRSTTSQTRSRIAVPQNRTPSAAPQNRTRSAAPQNRSRSAAPQIRSRSAAPQIRSRSAAPQIRSRSAAPQNRSRSAAPQNRSRSAAPQSRSRSAAPQNRSRSAAPQNRSRSAISQNRPRASAAPPASSSVRGGARSDRRGNVREN